jgi:predicted nuclease of restriction endonuclease-like RecB superfamily
MRLKCRICGEWVDWNTDKSMLWFLPRVCSQDCLLSFLRGYKSITKPNYTSLKVGKHPFKSECERSLAQFLDVSNIEYEYETVAIAISAGNYYIPDFILPQQGLFIEVKGIWIPFYRSKFLSAAREYTESFMLMNKEALKKLKLI